MTQSSSSTIILIIWRHSLNLNRLRKPPNIRLVVVGPSNMIVDESCIDVIHHVEGPITPCDQNTAFLMQKVRELCAGLSAYSQSSATNPPLSVAKLPTLEDEDEEEEADGDEESNEKNDEVATTFSAVTQPVQQRAKSRPKIALCVFERALQLDVAQIRAEFDIPGILPPQFDQLMHRKNMRVICRRGGLTTLRAVSLGSVQGRPDAWIECVNSQVGTYPMFLRPVVNVESNCMHTLCIAQNADDLRSWIRKRSQNSNYSVEYLVEECLENGYEFIAVASSVSGLLGTFTTIDSQRTLYASVCSQCAYGIEYLSAERTRDIMPGVESFVVQCMKTVFSRTINSILFLKGFYRGHNAITFIGGSMELRKRSLSTLFQEANGGKPWETFAVEALAKMLCAEIDPSRATNGHASNFNNRFSSQYHPPLTQLSNKNNFTSKSAACFSLDGKTLHRNSNNDSPSNSPHYNNICSSGKTTAVNHRARHTVNGPRYANNGWSLESSQVENDSSLSPSCTDYFALINFPCAEGFLLHQSTIAPKRSAMRLAWRVSEGEELLDADGVDENVLQIFLRNPNRMELLADMVDLIENVDITIDKLSLVDKRQQSKCITRRLTNICCNFDAQRYAAINGGGASSTAHLIRSCTTAD